MEEEEKDVYSVWALPDEEAEPRFRKLMEALRSKFICPRFDPHVTVVGATTLTADEAKKMFEAACDGLKAYTASVDRVSTGSFFYQCVFLLLKSTPEVMRAGEHCNECCRTLDGPLHTFYRKINVPHMSILYGDLTEEEKKKALEKVYTLDSSLDGLNFLINRVALRITDADVGSWVKINEHNLIS